MRLDNRLIPKSSGVYSPHRGIKRSLFPDQLLGKVDKRIAALTAAMMDIEWPATALAADGGHALRVDGRQGRRAVGRLDSSVSTLTVGGAYKTGESLEGSPPSRSDSRDGMGMTA